MILGGELGSNLGGATLQFILGGEMRSGHLIILSVLLSLFLILWKLLILNLLGGGNLPWASLDVQHHLEIDLVLGLVLEVEGPHFVLRKRVGLGLVKVPLE